MRHLAIVISRLIVYTACAAFSIACWVGLTLLVGCAIDARSQDLPDIYTPFRWTVNTARPALQTIEINRNETLPIEPQFTTYDGYVSLSNCVAVDLLYWIPGSNDANPWIVGGSVMNPAEGTVQIIWSPTNLVDAASVNFAVRLLGTDSASFKAQGKLVFKGVLQEGITLNPVTNTTLDAATITLLNAGSWPYPTVLDLAEVTAAAEAAAAANVVQDGAIATNADAIASNAVRIAAGETNLAAHIVQAEAKNDEQDAAIAEAAAGANMGKDVEGPSTNATVVAIQGIPVDPTPPTVFEDLYVLRYVHGTGMFTLMPAGTGSGTSISNIVLISDTAAATAVPFDKIGLYRGIRPGYLPTAVVNVGGYEVAWLDLLGITLKSGSINLLGSEMNVNVAAYDGSALAPAYTYQSDRKLGRYRFAYQGGSAEGYAASSNSVWFWSQDGIHLQPGKQYFGLPAETDPLSIQASTTYVAWTNAGGTHATNAVVATSSLLTNGLASVTWASTGPMSVRAETSTNQVTWITAVATANPVYVRISVANDPGVPGDATTAVSNIVAMSWSRPELVGQTRDTAGQVITVDTPATARAAANKAYVDAAAAGVSPANWADYPASAPIRANGQPILLGGGWTITEQSGFGVISFDLQAGTNAVTLSNNGVAAITAYSGLSGLRIDHFSIDSTTGTVGVATNGAVAAPMVQWTSDLVIPSWTTFEPLSTSYPDATTNGWYEYSVTLPDVPDGTPVFIRAVCQSGSARVDVHSPLYIEDQPVLTGFQVSGTNLLFVSGGGTNRITMEVWSE